MADENASSGHRLGQLVGNWYEEHVARPVLEDVAKRLGLHCESRWSTAGEKVLWEDADGNAVDYDFVFELREKPDERGIPVAFFETFWRRGSRHSKDKARDDSGKLVYMRDTYPTARALAIVAGGDFTRPAQDLVRSRGIELWYTSKDNVLSAWADEGMVIDYPDKSAEAVKQKITAAVEERLQKDPELQERVARRLFERIGKASIESFTSRVFSILSAVPQEFIVHIQETRAQSFASLGEITSFLQGPEPTNMIGDMVRSYRYEVLFGDGDVFFRDGLQWEELRKLHSELKVLIDHMEAVAKDRVGELHSRSAAPEARLDG
jgi:hypothetical protein